MNTLIADFPKHIDEALQIADRFSFQHHPTSIHNIVIAGMGGSGIGGELIAAWTKDQLNMPLSCFHDYTPPEYINKNTLLIASSYSGNTEETLCFMEGSRKKGAYIVGVCSGGKMLAYCQEYGIDCVVVPTGFQPRAALAFSLVQIANILTKFNYIDQNLFQAIYSSKDLLVHKHHEICEKAKVLAAFIHETVPVLYATTPYHAVLIRAQQQFNENSKMLCWTQAIPEMNHNELVGWGGGDARFSAVFFDTEDLSINNKLRMQFSREQIATKSKTLVVSTTGATIVERSMYLIHLVDWASWYLAELKQVDPFDIQVINKLKNALSQLNVE